MEFLAKGLYPPLIWFIIGLILIILEFANPGIVLVFFGIGAWMVALLCLFLSISINTQLAVFLISSILLLVFLRKWFKKLFKGKSEMTEEKEEILDQFFGKKALVTKAISSDVGGKVEFQGTYWDAESYETIPEGETVEIIDRNNITLIVKPLT
jgi:membrane protein implicated in regulation of membrane protease activity